MYDSCDRRPCSMMNIGVGEKTLCLHVFSLRSSFFDEAMSSSSSSSSMKATAQRVRERQGHNPLIQERIDEVVAREAKVDDEKFQEERKHAVAATLTAAAENPLPGRPPAYESEEEKEVEPKYSPASNMSDDSDFEIISENGIQQKFELDMAIAMANSLAGASPPEGRPPPPPPKGAAPDKDVQNEQLDEQHDLEGNPQRDAVEIKPAKPKLIKVGNEFEPWFAEGLAKISRLPQAFWCKAEEKNERICMNCLKPQTKFVVTYKDEEISTCSKTCLLWSLLYKMKPDECKLENAETQMVTTLLMKRQDNLHGKFHKTRPFHSQIDLAKDLKAKIEAYRKKVADLEKKPKATPEALEAHNKALDALQKMLMTHFNTTNENAQEIVGEKYTNLLPEYNTARLSNLKQKKANALEAKKLNDRLEKALKNAPTIAGKINGNYVRDIMPIMNTLTEPLAVLREMEKKIETAQEKIADKHDLLAETMKSEKFKWVTALYDAEEMMDELRIVARLKNELAEKTAKEAKIMRAFEMKMVEELKDSPDTTPDDQEIVNEFCTVYLPMEADQNLGQGETLSEHQELIGEILAWYTNVGAFVAAREKCIYLNRIDAIKESSSKVLAESHMEINKRDYKHVTEVNKVNKEALELMRKEAAEFQKEKTTYEKRKDDEIQKLKDKLFLADKKTELMTAERDKAIADLTKMQQFADLARSIGGAPRDRRYGGAQDEGYQPVHHGRRGSGRGRGNNQYHDNDAQGGDRKRNADASNCLGLLLPNGAKYCQFQFTNPTGCMKQDGCRYANTHGMKDPHPDHESRLSAKRAKSNPQSEDDKKNADKKEDGEDAE